MTLFSNEYQGGISFEVFTPQGSNPLANWKITGPGSKGTKKVYEKEVKGYVFSCPGGHGFKMQFPKDERKSMCLLQPFLCYQMHITEGQQFALELSVTTEDKTRRRLFLSTAFQELKATALHAQVPLRNNLRREGWTNLVFNAAALVENCFPNHSLRSIDLFILSGCFKLRRVFTLKQQPPDTVSSHAVAEVMEYATVPVPVALDFPVGVGRETQVLDGMTLFGKMQPLPNEKKAGTPVLSAVRQHPDGLDGAAGPLLELGIQGEAKKVSRERARGPASPPPRRRSARRILDSGSSGTSSGAYEPQPGSAQPQAPPGGGSNRLHANGMAQRSSSGNSRAAAEKSQQQQQHQLDDGRRASSAAVQRQAQGSGPGSSKGEAFPASSSSIERIEEAAATGRKALSAMGGSSSSSINSMSSSSLRCRAPSSRMSAAPPRVNIDPFDMSSSLQLPHSPPPLSPSKHPRQQLGSGNGPAGTPRSPSQHRLNNLKARDLPQVNGASAADPALSKWSNDGVTVSCSTSLMKLPHSSRYGDSGDGAELQQVSSPKRFWGDSSSVQPEDVPLHRQLDLENVRHSRGISGRERVPPLSQQSQQHSQQTMLLASGASSQLSSSSSRDHLGGGGRPQHSGAPAAPSPAPNNGASAALPAPAPPASAPPAASASAAVLTPVAAGSARNARRNLTYATTDDGSCASPVAPPVAATPPGASSAAPAASAAPTGGGGASVGSPSPSVSTSGMPPIVSPAPLPEAMQSTSPRGSIARNPRSVASLASFGQPGGDIPGTPPLVAFSGNSFSRNRVELESIERGGQHAQALSMQQPLGSSNQLEEASTRIADEVLDEVLRSSGSSAAEVQEEDEAVRASTAFAGPPEEEAEEEEHHQQQQQQETQHSSSTRQLVSEEEQPTISTAAVNEAPAALPQDPGPQQQLGAGAGARAQPESHHLAAKNGKPADELRNFLSRKVSEDLAGIEAQIAAARNEAVDNNDLWHSDGSLATSPRQRAPDVRKARTERWPELSDDTYSMLNMMNTQRAFTPPVVPASKVSETTSRTLKLEGTDLDGSPESELNSTQDSSIDYRDLIYDPILNCYYDSKSNQYFSLT